MIPLDVKELLATTDAQKWAAAFAREFCHGRQSEIDEGLLLAWFASAIETARAAGEKAAARADTVTATPGRTPLYRLLLRACRADSLIVARLDPDEYATIQSSGIEYSGATGPYAKPNTGPVSYAPYIASYFSEAGKIVRALGWQGRNRLTLLRGSRQWVLEKTGPAPVQPQRTFPLEAAEEVLARHAMTEFRIGLSPVICACKAAFPGFAAHNRHQIQKMREAAGVD